MTKIILLLIVITSTISTAAFACDNFNLVGFKGEQKISSSQARTLINAPFVAMDECNKTVKNRSGNLFIYTKDQEVLASITFYGGLTNDQKKQVSSKLKPGIILSFQDLKFGEEGKYVSNVTIMIK